MSDLEKAKSALRRNAQHGLIQAEREYVSFLDALRDWEAQLGLSGVTFGLEPGEVPETLEFQTVLGPIQVSRSLVLHDDMVVYALAFTDPTNSDRVNPAPPLWWVKLPWLSPWVDANGAEFVRDFATDVTKPHQVLELLQFVLAEKLLRNTRAFAPI